MGLRIGYLTIDCHDHNKVAWFWEQMLASERIHEGDHEVVLRTNVGGYKLSFYKVGDDKSVKNRLHLDLVPDDQDAEVTRLEELGATRVDIGQKDVSWVVMADPEGNEFCVEPAGTDPRA